MEIREAREQNINQVLSLHAQYQLATIAEEDKQDGFVSASFSRDELLQLIEQEQGLIIATLDDQVVAYAIIASWEFWSAWPMIQYLESKLDTLRYNGESITTLNSCQYGPVCIHKAVRGTGVLEKLYEFCQQKAQHQYRYFVTFISKQNPRSYKAHTTKTNLLHVTSFAFNDKEYDQLVGQTSTQSIRTCKPVEQPVS